jgi:hypothetical protein
MYIAGGVLLIVLLVLPHAPLMGRRSAHDVG